MWLHKHICYLLITSFPSKQWNFMSSLDLSNIYCLRFLIGMLAHCIVYTLQIRLS